MEDSLILSVKNLDVELGGEKIIEDLSFEVQKGDVLTILGPNGAGKSTLLKALLGLLSYHGEITWVPFVLSEVNYLPERLSRSNFKEIPISIREVFGFKEKSEEKIKEMLEMVGLKDLELVKNPGNLSAGQFQRMLIAWSLIGNPKVLIFDEPTAGIDIGGEETIFTLLHKFWEERNLTIIFVTHELDIIYAHSKNVLCLNKKKLCFGPPEEVLTPELLRELYGAEIKFYKHKHERATGL